MALANGPYKGNGLSLKIDDTEYNMDVVTVGLTSEDLDSPTFAEYAAKTKKWTLTATVKFDAGTGSVWRYVWENAGTTDVDFVMSPYGGSASDTKPQFTGTVTIPGKPSFDADAGSESTTDVAFEVDGEPELETS